ncbi:tetratricopeptide repeat protein [Solitalea sp. MAHUQ-68]|uniref:Tetratricopeptide repeat protein n=1 Tax=Solitalea agri TaxID=2953739 RepID=A0A9X2F377_9SPHI|nr:tetratricopeptide repeat protein [Solitalea agri]MCO4293939.1 tetratricopeptide repeat protein [Solitalea agri]
MKKSITIFVLALFTSVSLFAQSANKADSLYQVALNFYDKQDSQNAIVNFEEVLKLNPKHVDALYNLAVLQYELGNKQKAIELFQRSAALGDTQSKEILKQKLNVRLNYADTMDIADVDKLPQLLLDGKAEDLLFNNSINTKLLKEIANNIVASKDIKSRVFDIEAANKNIDVTTINEVKLKVGLLFGKDGSITVIPTDENFIDRKLVLEMMKASAKLGKVTPAQYADKVVCTRYYSIPLMYYKEENK